MDGMQVEIFLNVKKENKNGIRCGVGDTIDGVFNISCVASTDLVVMDYNLIAHALPSARFDESWSDPPIRVMAETNVSVYGRETGFVNDTMFFSGLIYESISGQPIVNSTVTVKIEDEELIFTTDQEGMVSLSHRFHSEGNKTINLIMDESTYYLGSNTSFGVSISPPPDTELGLLEMLTTFPNNLLVFGSCMLVIGAVYVYTQRGGPVVVPEDEEEEFDDEDLDSPIIYSDYKEGVVKLFNRFYKINQRRFKDIKESMTPREFQYTIIRLMPPEGKQPLEYLVTAFEIADYSLGRPTKDMFDKCQKAMDLLLGLMKDEQQEQ